MQQNKKTDPPLHISNPLTNLPSTNIAGPLEPIMQLKMLYLEFTHEGNILPKFQIHSSICVCMSVF